MKKYIYTIAAALTISAACFAQPAKEINVGGLKVILRTTSKDVISARLFIKGGTANYSKEKEGLENIALNLAVSGGTKSMDKLKFNDEAEKIGANFEAGSGLDYANMSMTCIKPYWDKSWSLFADAVLNPAFDSKEFELSKEKALGNAKQTEASPDGALNQIAMTETFKDRNYGKLPQGTVTSISGITLDDVKNHYNKIIGKSRCYLVVVGNVQEADLVAKVKETLSKMGAGTPAPAESKMVITKGSEVIVDRDIATNYLMGVMSAPSLATDEGVWTDMAFDILYDRFFVELRTKRSLSYAPAATYNRSAVTSPYSQIYISTTNPKKSLETMVEILDSVKKSGFTEKELKDKRESYLTNYYQKMETSSAQSAALGRSEATGSWKLDESFTSKVNAASLININKAFNKNTAAIKWTYLGKKDAVSKEDFKQTNHKDVYQSPY
ncbi:MAG TPA: pitrilysin family protein [Bacteroidia bacterium]|nr:pitrilysin family protein [Bacteroidia bacterium]HNU34255.1 pitrilysin family protein [Bacteroidia bacterium]